MANGCHHPGKIVRPGIKHRHATLRLGPLPKSEVVRLTIALPGQVKADLDRYVELYAAAYGEPVDAVALVPHMLAAFMDRDRGFRKERQAGGAEPGSATPSSASIKAATSSTSEAAGDSSSG